MKNNKNALLFLGIMAVLIAVIFIFRGFSTTDEAATTDQSGVTETTKPAAKIPTYNQALVLYKDKRIQLDTTCQASPNVLTFKNNTKIMIDNRSPKTRIVKVGSTMNINPWGFKIVTLYSANLPATWYVDCDGSQNVATILIQK